MKYILIIDNELFVGPFDSEDSALQYAKSRERDLEGAEVHIQHLSSPSK